MISVIIPTFNRAQFLKETLQSITRLDFVDSFEVIVIDNGSTDETANICLDFNAIITNFVYNYDAVPGLLTGRHKGWKLAKGDIITFIDDDVELSPNWLNGIENSFKDTAVYLVTGPCLPKYETYPPEWLSYFWDETLHGGKMCFWLSLLDLGPDVLKINPNYVWGLNFSIRRSALDQLNGFHPDSMPGNLQKFQGDGETGLTTKAEKKGFIALYNPEVLIYHKVPTQRMTKAYFEKRAFFQGVAQSFSDIRHKNFGNSSTPTSKYTPHNLGKKVLNKINWWLRKKAKATAPDDIIQFKKEISAFVVQGYQFHQQAFKNDIKVRDWVLKPNYLKYDWPEEKDEKDL